MRCQSCNVVLSDFEATRKYKDGTFADLCNHCWFNSDMYMNISTDEREDLSQASLTDEDEGENHAGHSD